MRKVGERKGQRDAAATQWNSLISGLRKIPNE